MGGFVKSFAHAPAVAAPTRESKAFTVHVRVLMENNGLQTGGEEKNKKLTDMRWEKSFRATKDEKEL